MREGKMKDTKRMKKERKIHRVALEGSLGEEEEKGEEKGMKRNKEVNKEEI